MIGPDDLVGVMTPEMSPSAITYSRRTTSIEHAVTDTWHWGAARQRQVESPQEQAIRDCYPTATTRVGIAGEMIARLREQQTLDALEALVDASRRAASRTQVRDGVHRRLAAVSRPVRRPGARARRPRADRRSARVPIRGPAACAARRAGSADRHADAGSLRSASGRCWPTSITRSSSAQLLQRANRANVSFYPIDARGLVVFDTPIEWGVPPSVDAAWLRKRSRRPADDGRCRPTARPCSTCQQRVAGDAEDIRRRRFVLPAELLLDQPDSSTGASGASASR